MARRYVDDLRTMQPEGPYRLAGYSLGGAVAFEMARILLAEGAELEMLAILDTTPGLKWSEDQPLPSPLDTDLLASVGEYLELHLGSRRRSFEGQRSSASTLWRDREALERIEPEERLRRFHQAAGSAGLLPPGTDARDLHRLLVVFASNLQAAAKYRPEPLDVPLCLLRTRTSNPDPTLGWGALTGHPIEVVEVPGDHATMLMGEGAVRVARELRRWLGPSLASPLAPPVVDPSQRNRPGATER